MKNINKDISFIILIVFLSLFILSWNLLNVPLHEDICKRTLLYGKLIELKDLNFIEKIKSNIHFLSNFHVLFRTNAIYPLFMIVFSRIIYTFCNNFIFSIKIPYIILTILGYIVFYIYLRKIKRSHIFSLFLTLILILSPLFNAVTRSLREQTSSCFFIITIWLIIVKIQSLKLRSKKMILYFIIILLLSSLSVLVQPIAAILIDFSVILILFLPSQYNKFKLCVYYLFSIIPMNILLFLAATTKIGSRYSNISQKFIPNFSLLFNLNFWFMLDPIISLLVLFAIFYNIYKKNYINFIILLPIILSVITFIAGYQISFSPRKYTVFFPALLIFFAYSYKPENKLNINKFIAVVIILFQFISYINSIQKIKLLPFIFYNYSVENEPGSHKGALKFMRTLKKYMDKNNNYLIAFRKILILYFYIKNKDEFNFFIVKKEVPNILPPYFVAQYKKLANRDPILYNKILKYYTIIESDGYSLALYVKKDENKL